MKFSLKGAPFRVRLAGAALAAAALSIYFFSPRFGLWRLLGTSEVPSEVVRARDALRQLAEPFLHIESPTNRVLEWRLFFPLVGHVLHLPDVVYLALPPIGAMLVLGLAVSLARQRGFGWVQSIGTATILATLSWFFVSVGWLAYFDSWCVLALLLVTFGRSQRLALATVLVAPWIDERFVLTLPLCLFLRSRFLAEDAERRGASARPADGAMLRELLVLGLALLPWGIVRAFFYFRGSDSVTALHLRDLAQAHRDTLLMSYVVGLWEGLRWGWLVLGALAVHFWRRSAVEGAIFIALLLGTVAVNLGVAVDFSRSVSVAAPAILFGLLLARWPVVEHRGAAIVGVAVLNLLTPARHVLGDHFIPIFYFPDELRRNDDPLRDFSAAGYFQNGLGFARGGQREAAVDMFGLAIAVSPGDIGATANRAMQLALLKRWDEALADADRAIALQSDAPDLWLNRAEIHAAAGQTNEALPDAAEAIRLAKGDWERMGEARAVVQKLRQ